MDAEARDGGGATTQELLWADKVRRAAPPGATSPPPAARRSRRRRHRPKVTLRLELSPEDVCAVGALAPPPLYVQVPRQGSVLAAVAPALEAWRELLPPAPLAPQLYYGTLPLRWHLPAGALYDLLVPEHDAFVLRLTLRVRGAPPGGTAPPAEGPAPARDALLHNLRAAAVLASGGARRVQEMLPAAKEELARAAEAADLASCLKILRSAGLAPPPAGAAAPAGPPPRVPFKLLVRADGGGRLDSYEGVESATCSAPAPVPLLAALLPPLSRALTYAARAGGAPGAAPVPPVAAAARLRRVWAAGAAPPMGAPLGALHAQLHAPDGFLYLVCHLDAAPDALH
jgi:hypothetical protein